jgi:PAS domain S-box-containing protein
LGGPLAPARAQPAPFVATNAQQILDLGLERARPGHIPARLRGTVTYPDRYTLGWVYIQDETAPLLVWVSPLPKLAPGDIIEATGTASAGGFAPYLMAREFRVVGHGPLPEPKRTSAGPLASGQDFGRWVSLEAMVRDVAISKERLVLLCSQGGVSFQVWTTQTEPIPPPVGLLDARVRLEGISWTRIDDQGQPQGFIFHQPGTNYITVLKPGASNIFAGPRIDVGAVSRRGADPDARVKVAGVVTLFSPDGWLALRDESGSLRANVFKPIRKDEDQTGQFLARSFPRLEPGDAVELVGVPASQDGYAPALDDAEYKLVGRAAPPAPRVISASDLASGQYDTELVALAAQILETETRRKGRIIDPERHKDVELYEHRFWLRADDRVCEAVLTTTNSAPPLAQRNSYVTVTGVCRVEKARFGPPSSARICLRSPADLASASAPPWWNSRAALASLGVAGGLALSAATWIVLLRRRVARSTAQLRAEIAERQRAQVGLARFKAVIEATSDLVAMANLDGTATYLNGAWRRLLGFPPDYDATRFHVEQAYPPWTTKIFQEEAFAAAARDGSWSGEVAVVDRDGKEIPVSFVGLVLRSADGKPEYMACVARDITERRRAEEQLRSALQTEKQLNQLKSNFISMVSHEIRTPLANILTSSEILGRYLDRLSDTERRDQLRVIAEAVDRMSDLLEDVLFFSRADAGRLAFQNEPFDLEAACRQCADGVVRSTGGRNPLRLKFEGVTEPARGDQSLLGHIVTNLLANAVKYSAPGAPVDLELTRDGETAVLRVRDQGIGISAEDQKQLFIPFFRGQNAASHQGTGLGLVIVRHCVERHGGQIEIESAEGLGSTITVRLPIFPPLSPRAATGNNHEENPHH